MNNGINDNKLHSVRIGQDYRAVVLKPDIGNVYVLIWVDHHDEAYQWAEKKVYKIHPKSGSIQVYNSKYEETIGEKPDEQISEKLFDNYKDKDLIGLSVPEKLLPIIRSISNEEELYELENNIPQESFEALCMLAAGYSVDEAYEELDHYQRDAEADTDDYATALENIDSMRRFYVIDNDIELQAILNAPLEKWRVFLHPLQRKLVNRSWSGPIRITGGAGTGKTVVAMHRAKWLAEKIDNKHNRILFTTFTRNLAADIKENLQKICTPELLEKIEVVNIDGWVSDYLKKKGYKYKIDYGYKSKQLWENALTIIPSDINLPITFYREEWEQIIQQQGITNIKEYFKASRVGRGTRISRKIREAIWPVFEEYRTQLKENDVKERCDALRDACSILRQSEEVLPYKSIIVDEAQDMGNHAFKLIRQIIPTEQENDIFIVGDGHQKIYKYKVTLSHCGINIRGRSKRLKINYRTTEETRKWAMNILSGIEIDDMDGGKDSSKGYKSILHGSTPVIKEFDSFEKEINFISAYIMQSLKNIGSIKSMCLVVRTNDLLEQYKSTLEGKGIITYKLKRSEAEKRNVEGLRIGTMHRIKGLEFDSIIIAGVNEGIVPLKYKLQNTEDAVVKIENEITERALLYVSATRAKKDVLITSSGTPSPYLKVNGNKNAR